MPTTMERPPQAEQRKKSKKEKKDQRNPLEKKFDRLFDRTNDVVKAVKKMSLNIERLVSHTKTMQGVSEDRKSEFLSRAGILQRKNEGIQERIAKELALLTKIQENDSFYESTGPIIEKRLKEIEKDLEHLKTDWDIKSASQELRTLGPKQLSDEHVELYNQIKGPTEKFLGELYHASLQEDMDELKKMLTNTSKSSQVSDIVLAAERLASKAKSVFPTKEDKERIDSKLQDLAAQLEQASVLSSIKQEQVEGKFEHHSLKPLDDYLDGKEDFAKDVEEALITIAHDLPDMLEDDQLDTAEKELSKILDKAKEFNRYRKKDEKSNTQAEKTAIYNEVSAALLRYELAETRQRPDKDKLSYIDFDKVDVYRDNPEQFLSDLQDELHAINLEVSSSGETPGKLELAYNSVLEKAEEIKTPGKSENEIYRLITEVDEMIAEYATSVILELIDDPDNRYTFESYTETAILLELQSILGISSIEVLPAHLKNQAEDIIDYAKNRCDSATEDEDRLKCLKSSLKSVGFLVEWFEDIASKDTKRTALKVHEIVGYKPTPENPPQLDLMMSDPQHLEEDVEAIIDWLQAEFGFEDQRDLIEGYFKRYVQNFKNLSESGNGEIEKMLKDRKKERIIKETIPDNKRANLMPLQIRNINKAIKLFIERETVNYRNPEDESTQLGDFLRAILGPEARTLGGAIAEEFNKIEDEEEAIRFLTKLYEEKTGNNLVEINKKLSEAAVESYRKQIMSQISEEMRSQLIAEFGELPTIQQVLSFANSPEGIALYNMAKPAIDAYVKAYENNIDKLELTDELIATLPENEQVGLKELKAQIERIKKVYPLSKRPDTAFVEFADLGEQDPESGLYTGEIGKGRGFERIDMEKDFPQKDPYDLVTALDFTSESTKEASYSIVWNAWSSRAANFERETVNSLPESTSASEKDATLRTAKKLTSATEVTLKGMIADEASGEEIYNYLVSRETEMKEELEQAARYREIVRDWETQASQLATTILAELPTATSDSEREDIKAMITELVDEYNEDLQIKIAEGASEEEIKRFLAGAEEVLRENAESETQADFRATKERMEQSINGIEELIKAIQTGDATISFPGLESDQLEQATAIALDLTRERIEGLQAILAKMDGINTKDQLTQDELDTIADEFLELYEKPYDYYADPRFENLQPKEANKVERINAATKTYLDALQEKGLVTGENSEYLAQLNELLADLEGNEYADDSDKEEILRLAAFAFQGGQSMSRDKDRPKTILRKQVYAPGWKELSSLADSLGLGETFSKKYLLSSARKVAEMPEQRYRQDLFLRNWDSLVKSLETSDLSQNQQVILESLQNYINSVRENEDLQWTDETKRNLIAEIIKLFNNQKEDQDAKILKRLPDNWESVESLASALDVNLNEFKGKRKERKAKRESRKAKKQEKKSERDKEAKKRERKKEVKNKRAQNRAEESSESTDDE